MCLRQGTVEAEVPQALRKPESIRLKLQQEVSPLSGNAFFCRGIKGEDESGEPELHLSRLKRWLN